MKKPTPLDEEVIFDGRSLISETDTKGKIIYVNRKFVEMSGYSKEEVVGNSHNILRHPDMPKQVYTQMWKTIKSGNIWEGYVKNLRKDGKYYWVIVDIIPFLDQEGNITRYISSRKVPRAAEIKTVIEQYAKMCKEEEKVSA